MSTDRPKHEQGGPSELDAVRDLAQVLAERPTPATVRLAFELPGIWTDLGQLYEIAVALGEALDRGALDQFSRRDLSETCRQLTWVKVHWRSAGALRKHDGTWTATIASGVGLAIGNWLRWPWGLVVFAAAAVFVYYRQQKVRRVEEEGPVLAELDEVIKRLRGRLPEAPASGGGPRSGEGRSVATGRRER